MLVVGGGASAVQFLGELAPVTDTLWVTRRPPVWRDDFDAAAGLAAVTAVEERVRRGLPPASVVSVTCGVQTLDPAHCRLAGAR